MFLGAFGSCEKRLLASVCLSVCVSVKYGATSTEGTVLIFFTCISMDIFHNSLPWWNSTFQTFSSVVLYLKIVTNLRVRVVLYQRKHAERFTFCGILKLPFCTWQFLHIAVYSLVIGVFYKVTKNVLWQDNFHPTFLLSVSQTLLLSARF